MASKTNYKAYFSIEEVHLMGIHLEKEENKQTGQFTAERARLIATSQTQNN